MVLKAKEKPRAGPGLIGSTPLQERTEAVWAMAIVQLQRWKQNKSLRLFPKHQSFTP